MATDLWDHDNKPSLKAIHISSRASQRATKTVKEYAFCQRYQVCGKALQVTMCIKHSYYRIFERFLYIYKVRQIFYLVIFRKEN